MTILLPFAVLVLHYITLHDRFLTRTTNKRTEAKYGDKTA